MSCDEHSINTVTSEMHARQSIFEKSHMAWELSDFLNVHSSCNGTQIRQQYHPKNHTFESRTATKRRSEGISPLGMRLPIVTNHYPQLWRIERGGAGSLQEDTGIYCGGERRVESGSCMLWSSWWGKGGARRDGKEGRREGGLGRAVVPADPSAIVSHSQAQDLR